MYLSKNSNGLNTTPNTPGTSHNTYTKTTHASTFAATTPFLSLWSLYANKEKYTKSVNSVCMGQM